MDKKKHILWEVGCEGHSDAWVSAQTWEEATIKAAEFWGVPWSRVAAYCVEKQKVVGAPKNVCCRCGRIYFGNPPMCISCEKSAKLEEEETQRRLAKAYRMGKAI